MPKRIAVLASGTGTVAQALLDASLRDDLAGGSVVVVVSDREGAGALQRARAAGIEAVFLDPAACEGRAAYDRALVEVLTARAVGLVCLAGFMRILTPAFIDPFRDRVLNTHPALLPSFPGAHAVRDALAWGAKVTGATVHFADEQVDHGPIVLQAAVPVLPGDDETLLHERIKQVERRLFPEAVRLAVSDRLVIRGRTVEIGESLAGVTALPADR
ncbi:MAG: phosphoribosylglycinamide formyltransferase [Actinomycetota bacterium]